HLRPAKSLGESAPFPSSGTAHGLLTSTVRAGRRGSHARPAGDTTGWIQGNMDTGGHQMNWDRIEGSWKQMKGKVRQQWGKLTDDDLETIAGKKDELSGKIQQRYGIAKDEAEKQLDDWSAHL